MLPVPFFFIHLLYLILFGIYPHCTNSKFAPQVRRRNTPAGPGLPVHRQARRGVPGQLEAGLQDHQAGHQGGAGVLRGHQLEAAARACVCVCVCSAVNK